MNRLQNSAEWDAITKSQRVAKNRKATYSKVIPIEWARERDWTMSCSTIAFNKILKIIQESIRFVCNTTGRKKFIFYITHVDDNDWRKTRWSEKIKIHGVEKLDVPGWNSHTNSLFIPITLEFSVMSGIIFATHVENHNKCSTLSIVSVLNPRQILHIQYKLE